jgi:hypothetical protein
MCIFSQPKIRKSRDPIIRVYIYIILIIVIIIIAIILLLLYNINLRFFETTIPIIIPYIYPHMILEEFSVS